MFKTNNRENCWLNGVVTSQVSNQNLLLIQHLNLIKVIKSRTFTLKLHNSMYNVNPRTIMSIPKRVFWLCPIWPLLSFNVFITHNHHNQKIIPFTWMPHAEHPTKPAILRLKKSSLQNQSTYFYVSWFWAPTPKSTLKLEQYTYHSPHSSHIAT